MICDLPDRHQFPYARITFNSALKITVYKFFTISFHEKYRRVWTKNGSKDEIYVMKFYPCVRGMLSSLSVYDNELGKKQNDINLTRQ